MWNETLDSVLFADTHQLSGASLFATEWPLATEGGASVQGLFIGEDVRLEMRVLARDNYDRARDFSYMMLPDDEAVAPHNRYADSEINLPLDVLADGPYLPRVGPGDIGTVSGYAITVEHNGIPEVVGDYAIFREANYPSGESLSLVVQASDEGGNCSRLAIPINVLERGFRTKELQFRNERR